MKQHTTEKHKKDLFEKLSLLTPAIRHRIILGGALLQALFSVFVFLYLRIYIMLYICLALVVLFLFMPGLARKEKFRLLFYLILTGFCVAEIAAMHFVEWEYGFHLSFFVLVPLSFTFLYNSSSFSYILKNSVSSFGLIVGCYLLCSVISAGVQPVSGGSSSFISLVYDINSFLTFLILLIYMTMFMLQLSNATAMAENQAKIQLENQRVTMMLSQIKPHFMYNTLSAIAATIEENPKEAQRLVYQFSRYMRGNIDSLSGNQLISFSEELKHITAYSEIEMFRFGERVRVDFDIKPRDFLLPPLTVQPLVENAIKHGIREGTGSGVVKVSTREEGSAYLITIEDNGRGFDTSQDNKRVGSAGLANVEYRLQAMCGGSLSIESAINIGTKVTVSIPKSE